jgi:ATP-dependent RNA helicase DHX36
MHHLLQGAGKTTQCPQFLLEQGLEEGLGDKTSIICTQPRRISALSVAERVAEEMDENIGDHVGYQIRMEARRSKNTRLMFCTTGVILRRLQDDPNLTGVSCVCVDECHERQWQIDFLLIALRKLIQTTRKDLKIVLVRTSCFLRLL